MVAIGVATGETIVDGTIKDIMGDGIGEWTAEGAGETRSELDDHSGDGVSVGCLSADTLPGLSGFGTDPEPYPTLNVLYTWSSSTANSWRLNAP
ncbi:hypothetical protein Tco_0203708 [Tanacetum coccineum]